MNPLVIYLLLVGLAIGMSLVVMLFSRPSTRACPGCERDVRIDARACLACGYALR